jgi:hypothetical protein
MLDISVMVIGGSLVSVNVECKYVTQCCSLSVLCEVCVVGMWNVIGMFVLL